MRYDALVAEGLEANPIKEAPKGKRGRKAKGKKRCLLERLRDYKADILRFASDWSVPFTNNEAERCVRFSKVKEKVSGCFRTKTGADNFMRIMSYIGSAKKHGIDAEMMFCTTFEPLMEEDVFRNIVRKNSFFLNRQQLRWVTSRFQIRDRINHVAFIFEVRNDFKEIYLITVMVAGEGEKIQLKRSTICFDIAPSYASYDGTVVSQVTALDWRNLYNCRGIPMARVEITASDFSWEY